MCEDLRAVSPLQVRDGILMYTQMLGMGTAEQFQVLKLMRSRREAAAYSAPTMTPAERKALRDAPTRDELVAKLVVPDRGAFQRFREERLAGLGSTDDMGPTGWLQRDSESQQYLRLHARHSISAYHILSQNFYTYAVNPNVGWHVDQTFSAEKAARAAKLQAAPSTAPVADLDKRRRQEMRRKAERDQLEIQKIIQSIQWFEYQLRLGQVENDSEARKSERDRGPLSVNIKPWGINDPEREQKLRRAIDIKERKLPKHVAQKRQAQASATSTATRPRDETEDRKSEVSNSPIRSSTERGADTDEPHRERPAAVRQTDVEVQARKNTMLDEPLMELDSTLHWREERFAAIERRLGSMRAAKRLDVAATRRQVDESLQSRIRQLDSDTALVEDWEYQYKRRVAWSRMEARQRRFESEVYRHLNAT